MNSNSNTAFLYTDGGIVPKYFFNNHNFKIIHCHPGLLPEIKGSDCLLWSASIRRKLGASCFYMSSNIDEGQVIERIEQDIPNLPTLLPFLGKKMIDYSYYLLNNTIDPHIRAQLLLKVISKYHQTDLRKLPSISQPIWDRTPFLKMHPKIKFKLMSDLFI